MSTNSKVLVLGATGSIGYAVTENLLARQFSVTILVRNRAKAEALFPNQPTLTIVEGDVQDAELLKRVAADQSFIFHGINYPYDQWFGNMDTVTQKVIDAASQNGSTIIFPGNVYGFGNTKEPIQEDSPLKPASKKGQLRIDIEAMLEKAANAGRCRVLNVRLPDFWGPNVLNDGVRPIFENALKGKALPWLYSIDVPHQSVYTKDAAEVIARLLLRLVVEDASDANPVYQVFNYGGQVHTSMRSFFSQIAEVTGKPLKTQVYSPLVVAVLGLFNPIVREVKEMSYLYQNTVRLDDTKVRSLFPDFQETPLKEALAETLIWFAKNQLKIDFTPSAGVSIPNQSSADSRPDRTRPDTRQGLNPSIS